MPEDAMSRLHSLLVQLSLHMCCPFPAADDCTMRLWEVRTGRCMRTWQLEEPVTCVAWCPAPQLQLAAGEPSLHMWRGWHAFMGRDHIAPACPVRGHARAGIWPLTPAGPLYMPVALCCWGTEHTYLPTLPALQRLPASGCSCCPRERATRSRRRRQSRRWRRAPPAAVAAA